MNQTTIQILVYGNCDFVSNRGKEAYGKDMSPRTGTWYKADDTGELAPHSEALGSVSEVNHGVVYRNSVFLPGEASMDGKGRFRFTAKASAPVAAMSRASSIEESAASIVVVEPESVSSRRRVTRPVKSAAQQIR